jgi:hypothetical protein
MDGSGKTANPARYSPTALGVGFKLAILVSSFGLKAIHLNCFPFRNLDGLPDKHRGESAAEAWM